MWVDRGQKKKKVAPTDWDDIQRRYGNRPQLESSSEDEAAHEHAPQDPLAGKTVEELDELEDDEDEAVLRRYREERMREWRERQARRRFEGVREIKRHQFVREVSSNPDADRWIVLLLYADHVEACQLVLRAFLSLAEQHQEVEFLKIEGRECMDEYPDEYLPTIFVYHGGKQRRQWITLSELGASRFTANVLEWQLAELGALSTSLDVDPLERYRRVVFAAGMDFTGEEQGEDDD
eukprot:TRINITY_DN10985_c0_g1_i1.p1 TRINITY_DN10985_c0_g1~~TRINITY_DN10985_c0_g1_i1.p1  ORF type:complete len:236 (+),score=87.64 TRINITY_DN10985_c0_g1_i1:164-871(+)